MLRTLFLSFVVICAAARSDAASFTFLGTQSVAQLDQILTIERAAFAGATTPGYKLLPSTLARNAVDVYRVSYPSVIPERDNRPTVAYGLVAIPKIDTKKLPVVSYQHGTVWGKYEVPSYSFSRENPSGYSQYDGSFETRLMVAQFAGQGYVVLAADYFGMGDSKEPEGYTVKGSHQQACADLYDAVIAWLATEKGIQQTNLFLAGWSQGGLNTTGFLEKLESRGAPVKAASTASSPNDPFALMSAAIYNPRPIDAPWLVPLIGFTVFSYENYFSKPGLAASVLNPACYETLRKVYRRDYASFDELTKVLFPRLPSTMKAALREEYADPTRFATSEYGKLLAQLDTYRWVFKTPLSVYYGTLDEAIPIPLGQLAATYQAVLGRDKITTTAVQDGTHRGTFLTAVVRQKEWFDSLNEAPQHVATSPGEHFVWRGSSPDAVLEALRGKGEAVDDHE
jgi:acetyl esterase/lipase